MNWNLDDSRMILPLKSIRIEVELDVLLQCLCVSVCVFVFTGSVQIQTNLRSPSVYLQSINCAFFLEFSLFSFFSFFSRCVNMNSVLQFDYLTNIWLFIVHCLHFFLFKLLFRCNNIWI